MNVLRIAQNKKNRIIINLKSRVNTTSTYINNNIMSFDNCLIILILYFIKLVKLCIEYL